MTVRSGKSIEEFTESLEPSTSPYALKFMDLHDMNQKDGHENNTANDEENNTGNNKPNNEESNEENDNMLIYGFSINQAFETDHRQDDARLFDPDFDNGFDATTILVLYLNNIESN